MEDGNIRTFATVRRSRDSVEQAYVRFYNKTDRAVEIIWINYLEEYKKYRILMKDEFVDVNTFKSHPWIALDHQTQERLHIDKTFTYYPKTSREIFQETHPGLEVPRNHQFRRKSYITLPLYSLRFRAMLEIRNCIQEPTDVDLLELPKNIANELKVTITYRNNLRDIPSFN